jgi:hypothetical protein
MTIKEKSVVRLGKTNQGEKFGLLMASMFTDLLRAAAGNLFFGLLTYLINL